MGRSTGTQAEHSARKTDAPTLVSVAPANDGVVRDDVLAAMAAAVVDQNPGSTAEALRTLRMAYPDHPLALRLAAARHRDEAHLHRRRHRIRRG